MDVWRKLCGEVARHALMIISHAKKPCLWRLLHKSTAPPSKGYGVTDLSQYCIIGIIWPETRRGGRWQKPVLTKEHAIKLQRLLFGIFIVTLGQSRLSYIWFSEAQKGLANAPSDAKNIRNRNLLSLKRSQNKIMGSVRLLSRWPQKQKENNELKQTGLKNAEKSEIIRMVDKNLQQKSWDIRYLLQLSSAKKQKWR